MGQPSRGYLLAYCEYIAIERRTRGTETSKYPEEKKTTVTPLVAASESGLAHGLEPYVLVRSTEWSGKANHRG